VRDLIRMLPERLLALFIPLLLPVACRPEAVTVTYFETRNGVARFDVQNRTERDIRSMSFELSFYSETGAMVHVDTVGYSVTRNAATGDTIPFVRAESETFFVTKAPTAAVSATGRVLAFTFMDDERGTPR